MNKNRINEHRTEGRWLRYAVVAVMIPGIGMFAGAQCPGGPSVPSLPIFNNMTDKTNNDAGYIGSAACSACHPGIAEQHALHGHASMINVVQGAAPEYPDAADHAGVSNPPAGFDWTDFAYVIGGHNRGAVFINDDGYLLTNGTDGVDSQWQLDFPANGTEAGFASYLPGQVEPLPYDFSCFRCHATGPMEQDPDSPMFQDGRPGIAGTWAEAGVQCEACHGPGSNHAPNPSARNIFVDPTGTMTCNQCHNRPFDSDGETIFAADGYVLNQSQFAELKASGGHSSFRCGFCHESHSSVVYDRDSAIRNDCTACHADQNMAIHEGKVFTRGDYTETLTCESCHMPYASRKISSASEAIVGDMGRMGDTRTHIFRINTNAETFEAMFAEDGMTVRKDEMGRSAVTLDFVCLRCHNGIGAFDIRLEVLSDIAFEMHREF